MDVPGLLGVQFLSFSVANFSSTTNADLSVSSVVCFLQHVAVVGPAGTACTARSCSLCFVMQSVVASPSDAAFSLAGVSGLPTIAPVLGVLGLQRYTLNSLFIAPLIADNMTVTFTPFTGALW